MTIKDLIKLLESMPENAEVRVWDYYELREWNISTYEFTFNADKTVLLLQ